MSGLNQRFTKPSSLYRDREFESRSLRIDNLLVACPDCSTLSCDPYKGKKIDKAKCLTK
jgi:hypothetical protein